MSKKSTDVDKVRLAALEQLAVLGGSTTGEDDIAFEGTKIVLPATFSGDLSKVIQFLAEKRDEEEKNFAFSHTFKYRPLDGAAASARVIKNLFGMTLGKAIQTMFGEIPPQLIDVPISATETIQAPWGAMGVPGLDGLTLYFDQTRDPELGSVFQLHGEGPRKYRHIVEGLYKAIENELLTGSIYKGKAISGQERPNFLDLSSIDPESVVYADDVVEQLHANVWVPIEQADRLADLGEPGKRAVVFEGPYGTGKTLGAYLTAQRAVAAGWTFLMARPGRDNLEQVIQTARMYQPAVVFTEDIDTVASADNGDADHMAKVLDLFDGLDTKGLRLMLVLTTNNIDTLHPAMLRPGRLDSIISINDLDERGIEKLARYVLGDSLAEDIDWGKVWEAHQGYTPAYVREVFGRVIRYALARGDDPTARGVVTTGDLVHAAEGLRPQHDIARKAALPPEGAPDVDRSLEAAVRRAMEGAEFTDKDGDSYFRLQPDGEK